MNDREATTEVAGQSKDNEGLKQILNPPAIEDQKQTLNLQAIEDQTATVNLQEIADPDQTLDLKGNGLEGKNLPDLKDKNAVNTLDLKGKEQGQNSSMASAPEKDTVDLIHGAQTKLSSSSPEQKATTNLIMVRKAAKFPEIKWSDYAFSLLAIFVCSIISEFMLSRDLPPTNMIMIYLLGVVFVAMKFSPGSAVFTSLVSVLAFDYLFVPPYFQFAHTDIQYVITMIVMLLVAIVLSAMSSRIKSQALSALQKEQRTSVLYALSKDFAIIRGTTGLIEAANRHLGDIFHCHSVILLPDSQGQICWSPPERKVQPEADKKMDPFELKAAQWSLDNRQATGPMAPVGPPSFGIFLPLLASQGPVGVLGLFRESKEVLTIDQLELLEALANQTALALERAHLGEMAYKAAMEVQTERMRNALLSSVSHDLRTPLSAITGAASSLLLDRLDLPSRNELAQSIYDESGRLNRLLRNLLDMTRLESGSIKVKKEWGSLEEVAGAALSRLEERLAGHQVKVAIPTNLPLVQFDDTLLEQVFINLLDNAVKYSPSNSDIEIKVTKGQHEAVVQISNSGSMLAPGDERRVFQKFYRGKLSGSAGGTGLGLTISQGMIEAHGGKMWAESGSATGTSFFFTLPMEGISPFVEMETLDA